jgi:ABC-2 type transport system ATP-binding protein
LLHEPSLLVLDEPTVGVDPQSRNAILSRIADLQGQGMAVIYTTHYMEEAERLCDRIAVMDEGRIVAEGTTAELVALVGELPVIRLNGQGDFAGLGEVLEGAEGVIGTTASDGRIDVVADGSGQVLEGVLRLAMDHGVQVSGVSIERPDLEDVFLHVTGKALRD